MGDQIGDRVGPRLAALVGKYVTAARSDHAPIEARIRQVATQKLIDKAGQEVADHLAEFVSAAIEANPDMHPAVKGYLTRTASGKHQLQAIAGHLAMAGATSVLSTLLSNELAPFGYDAVSLNPHLRVDQSTAATLAAQGIIDIGTAQAEGNAQGYDNDRMGWLIEAAVANVDSATLGQLLNRGLIEKITADFLINRAGYPASIQQALLALRFEPLSPADAALAVLRTEMSQDAGAAKAALSGVTGDDFGTLVANTGEPPGAETLMEALRRRLIDEERFRRGIAQSRIRNEWDDVLLALRFEPMSTADAVEAVVQNHLTADQAAQIAEDNGLEPGQVSTLIENAGEPLSRTELEQLYNRGEIDLATVKQGLRESRLKDKYVDDAVLLRRRLPEPRQVVSMVAHGVLTHDQAAQLLIDYGFTPADAALLIAEGTATKLGAHKDLTVGEIKQLYSDGVFSAAQAGSYLQLLGYDASESGFLIASWDMLAQAATTRQAVNVIRSRFVARKLDWPQAAALLTALGIPDTAQAKYQATWTIEQDARVAGLSEAQIVKAHKDGLISGQDAHDRLAVLGYPDDDVNILLGVAPGAPLPP